MMFQKSRRNPSREKSLYAFCRPTIASRGTPPIVGAPQASRYASMVINRRATQKAHEHFNINVYLSELNRRHLSTYEVISEPSPPEAIISVQEIDQLS